MRKFQVVNAPFIGWCPDLPPHLASMRGAQSCKSVVAMTQQGLGEFLRADDGFVRVDSARLPLGGGRATTLLRKMRHPGGAVDQYAVNAGIEAGGAGT